MKGFRVERRILLINNQSRDAPICKWPDRHNNQIAGNQRHWIYANQRLVFNGFLICKWIETRTVPIWNRMKNRTRQIKPHRCPWSGRWRLHAAIFFFQLNWKNPPKKSPNPPKWWWNYANEAEPSIPTIPTDGYRRYANEPSWHPIQQLGYNTICKWGAHARAIRG